jgi:hypothetical protein
MLTDIAARCPVVIAGDHVLPISVAAMIHPGDLVTLGATLIRYVNDGNGANGRSASGRGASA